MSNYIEAGKVKQIFRDSKDFPNQVDRCCIVGNSAKLLENENGSKIDSHDVVVRFNAAPIRGYEKYIGSKTDYRFVNSVIQRGDCLKQTTNTPKDFISTLRNQTIITKYSQGTTRKLVREKVHESIEILELGRNGGWFYYQIMDRFNISPKNYMKRELSLGIRSLLIFLQISNQVNLFGFDFYQGGDLKKHHYWEDFTDHNQSSHDFKKEQELAEKLSKNYNVKIY